MTALTTVSSNTVSGTPEQDTAEAAWKDAVDAVTNSAALFSDAAAELADLLGAMEFDEDIPEEVREAAEDACLAVYDATDDVERRLRSFHAAVVRVDADDEVGQS